MLKENLLYVCMSQELMDVLQQYMKLLQERSIPFHSKVTIEFQMDSKDLTPAKVPVVDDTSSVQSSNASESAPYEKVGMDILDKDHGVLRSFGYETVRNLTVNERRQALVDAVEYGNDPRYVQERLYYVARVQSIREPNPFEEDLEWFEKEYNLRPYQE